MYIEVATYRVSVLILCYFTDSIAHESTLSLLPGYQISWANSPTEHIAVTFDNGA